MSEERNDLNELNAAQVEHEYGASEIQVLEGLEAVQHLDLRRAVLVLHLGGVQFVQIIAFFSHDIPPLCV